MSEVQLQAWDWMTKMLEKMTFIHLKILNHDKNITENDEDILKIWFRIWWNEEMPFYKTQMDGVNQTVIQGGLFADITADDMYNYTNGTEVDLHKEVTTT